ncbi:hypothetical protein [Thiococcus pfennigii]|nr:hypothetical protein [Thiococcus pfennigii]
MSNTQIDRYEIEPKHLDKVFFPDAGITKGDFASRATARSPTSC